MQRDTRRKSSGIREIRGRRDERMARSGEYSDGGDAYRHGRGGKCTVDPGRREGKKVRARWSERARYGERRTGEGKNPVLPCWRR
ncbi:hypothetical protein ALC60_01500 [Trachymyrmex zeteki]|uniref:Uncharacterized protein n=1 Tax=Mycetomoellerius zeteki TaxID=64791 RepID=A0A151XGS4_9HYME|nr:hypothetical protein ALC60_01500 [Trachymyrmex zeteki]